MKRAGDEVWLISQPALPPVLHIFWPMWLPCPQTRGTAAQSIAPWIHRWVHGFYSGRYARVWRLCFSQKTVKYVAQICRFWCILIAIKEVLDTSWWLSVYLRWEYPIILCESTCHVWPFRQVEGGCYPPPPVASPLPESAITGGQDDVLYMLCNHYCLCSYDFIQACEYVYFYIIFIAHCHEMVLQWYSSLGDQLYQNLQDQLSPNFHDW